MSRDRYDQLSDTEEWAVQHIPTGEISPKATRKFAEEDVGLWPAGKAQVVFRTVSEWHPLEPGDSS